MSVQDVRRAKAYARSVEEAFTKGWGEFSRGGKGVKKAFALNLGFQCIYQLREVVFDMAKAAQNGHKGNIEFKGFVNYKLTPEDKDVYAQWDIHDNDLYLILAADAQAGYKLTVSWNDQNSTFTATYICNDTESAQKGYCLSAYAPDWYSAVRILAFKHNEILNCQWPIDERQQLNDWG
jgi:hypothetical protein